MVTDNGNFIVDVDVGPMTSPSELNKKLKEIPGIIENGLFIGMVHKAYFGQLDGTVSVQVR